MFQYLRKAVTGSQISDNSRNNLIRDEYQKKQIKSYLSDSIKQLQRKYIDNPECTIERDDEDAQNLCMGLEAAFLHGLVYYGNTLPPGMTIRSMFSDGIRSIEESENDVADINFWELVKEVTHSDVISQLKHLVVTTNVGLSRAWIRLAVNDALIVSYLDAMLADSVALRKYYGENAFLMDTELPSILKELLQGLVNFQFRLNYNSSKLNIWDPIPLQLAGLIQGTDLNMKKKALPENKSRSNSTTEKLKDLHSLKKTVDELQTKRKSMEETNEKAAALDSSMTMPSEQEYLSVDGSINKDLEEDVGNSVSMSIPNTLDKSERHDSANESSSQAIMGLSVSAKSDSSVNQVIQDSDKLGTQNNQQRVIGNRLGGQGWEGWSSSFETEQSMQCLPTENSKTLQSNSHEDDKTKSFGTLLQQYGGNNGGSSGDSFESNPIDENYTGAFPERASKSLIENDLSDMRMNYEVVPVNELSTDSLYGYQSSRITLDALTTIGIENGLDTQNFGCKQCSKPIGLIYGPYRICHFDGGYYCSDCHDEEESLIPARVLQNWEFRKYKVSKDNKLFLMKIEEEPLFHIDEVNPTLYDVIADLKHVKHLRFQLQHIKEYIHTCRQEVSEDFRRKLWPREYLSEDIHQYSLLDLVQVQNGQLAHHLRKIISQCTKHIMKCSLCCQKGFICEYCNDETIIYPFQINITVQCQGCLSVFHKKCRVDKRCPKCIRIHKRSQNKNDDIDRRLSVTQKEQYIDVIL